MADKSLHVYRCHWCGKPVTKEPTSLNVIEEITILCSGCLDWEVNPMDGKMKITLGNLRRQT